MRIALVLFLVLSCLTLAPAARAEPRAATFALIMGVNRSADRELPELRYADDDAARYQELFRLLGARTYLLTRMDENTQRLHAQAAAEALFPRRAELERSMKSLTEEVRQARRRGVRVVLYVVYAGHGNVKSGEAYVLLENDRLNAKRLAELVRRPGADEVHLIVDACNSGLLAASRGPGGKRRPLAGFSQTGPLVEDARIGLLLSTSSGRESHEWEQFQAGVFSHEVRSGLYGAADANRDAKVSYREIAAFVKRANAAIPNERFRPDVFARAPAKSENLVSLKRAMGRRIEVRSKLGSRFLLENSLGVRLADFHPNAEHEMRILRPANELLFLRRLPPAPLPGRPAEATGDEAEFEIPAARDVIRLAELESAPPRVALRGAAHESFNLLFALPFDQKSVHDEPLIPSVAIKPEPPREPQTEPDPWRRTAGIGLVGVGAAAASVGAALFLSGEVIRLDGEAGVSQREIAERNDRVSSRRTAGLVAFGVAAGAAATGVTLLLWQPSKGSELSASARPDGVLFTYRAQ